MIRLSSIIFEYLISNRIVTALYAVRTYGQ